MSKPRYIAHTGGKQPVSPGARVEVCLRNGAVFSGSARDMIWGRGFWAGGIIAYRVIK